jgi:hypothetical protein
MNTMELDKKKVTAVASLVILLIGLGVGIFLVQTKHVFKSRADEDITSRLETRDASGQLVRCENNICTTDSDTVTVKLNGDPNSLFAK